jgi:hypothetical protein
MSEAAKRRWADPEQHAKMSAGSKRQAATEAGRAHLRALAETRANAWADPEYRARGALQLREMLKRQQADPEYHVRASDTAKRRWADPEYRAKAIAARTGKKRGPYRRQASAVVGVDHG